MLKHIYLYNLIEVGTKEEEKTLAFWDSFASLKWSKKQSNQCMLSFCNYLIYEIVWVPPVVYGEPRSSSISFPTKQHRLRASPRKHAKASQNIFIEETLISILQQNPLPRSHFFATHKQGLASLKYVRQESSPNRLRTCAR